METLIDNEIEEQEDREIIDNISEEINKKIEFIYENEKLFLDSITLKLLIYAPKLCPKNKKNSFKIYENKSQILLIHIILNALNAKKTNIRKYSFNFNICKINIC